MLRNCTNIAKVLGIDLVCPVDRYKSTSNERLDLVCFYESEMDRQSTAREEYR